MSQPGSPSSRASLNTVIMGGLVVLAMMTAVAAGTGGVVIPATRILAHASEVLTGWGEPLSARDAAVLFQIRLPRVVLAICVGSALSLAGTALQGVFRNPLADPALIGVSAGGALAAAATIVLAGGSRGLEFLLPFAAFCGAGAATGLVFWLARRDGVISVAGVLLAGIAVNALAGAGIGLLSYLGDDLQLRQLTFWMLGSLAAATWQQVIPAGVVMLAACCALLAQARTMDVFVLGEREAFALGVNPTRFTVRIVVLAALAVGAAVAVSGLIAFVGLVVPHMVRLMLGPSHRGTMPVAMILGALAVIAADTVARTIAMPAEVPIGLLLSLIGSPVFLWLLRRNQALIR